MYLDLSFFKFHIFYKEFYENHFKDANMNIHAANNHIDNF